MKQAKVSTSAHNNKKEGKYDSVHANNMGTNVTLVPASVSLSSSMSYASNSISVAGSNVSSMSRNPTLRIRKRPTATASNDNSNIATNENLGDFYTKNPEEEGTSRSIVSTSTVGNSNTMIEFAKRAAKAGYLWKLGTNVREYKRRFFVLKPTTYLFYFVSENDTEPRGCIDLEKEPISISPLHLLPDGRCRFQLTTQQEEPSSTTAGSIHLEARTQSVANEWITALTTQRFSYTQDQITQQQTQISEYEAKIQQLEQENHYYRSLEQERDNYREEATQWKNLYQQLTQDITKELHKFDPSAAAEEVDAIGQIQNTCNLLWNQKQTLEQQLTSSQETVQQLSTDGTSLQKRMQKAERLITKLWEENCNYQMKISKLKRDRKILATEIQTLRQLPAAAAPHPTNRNLPPPTLFGSAEKRLLCELEQDIVSSLKLHDKFLATSRGEVVSPIVVPNHKPSTTTQQQEQKKNPSITSASLIPTISNNRTASPHTSPSKWSISGSTSTTNTTTTLEEIRNHSSLLHMEEEEEEEEEDDEPHQKQLSSAASSPIQPRVLMLGAHNVEESSCSIAYNSRNTSGMTVTPDTDHVTISSGLSFSSSLPPNCTETKGTDPNNDINVGLDTTADCTSSSVLNTDELQQNNNNNNDNSQDNNPMLLLLDEDEEMAASSYNSSRSIGQPTVTKPFSETFGCATATLQCPLLDDTIVHDNRSHPQNDSNDSVLHITFTSRKIGIQFQKVQISKMPSTASSSGSIGKITEDIRISEQQCSQRPKGNSSSTTSSTDSHKQRFYKTLMDLKAVASFATSGGKLNPALNYNDNDESILCQVPQPVDAVLVCGFCGFDEETHPKPSIGSRLIAFDGISIEVGRWTFESVRKAIQARKRPLTLSFRNDALTREQRDIITRASQEMKNSSDSIASSNIINSCNNYLQPITEDWFPPPPLNITTEPTIRGSNSSICSRHVADGDYSTIGSNRSVSSFSDAGTATSSIVSLAVGPLVASILWGLSSKSSTDRSPSWPRCDEIEQKNAKHLEDFQSELL